MTGLRSRRTFLRAGLASLAVGISGCQSTGSEAQPTGTPTGHDEDTTVTTQPTAETTERTTTSAQLPERVGAEAVATGLTAPLDIAFPSISGIDAYVVDQAGQVVVLDSSGVRSTPLLDVTDRMVDLSGYEERGLLGLALHPNFADNGRLFARYSGPAASSGFDHTFVLSEFETTDDGTRVVDGSERRLLEIPEPQSNHNGGPIVFGPDDYLYVGVGDGGGGGDQGTGHVSDWYEANRGGNGQDVSSNLLGSVLRIDVDSRTASLPYGIPSDNPLVDREGLDEHFAWGFRNPWGMSFTGDELFVADVGQRLYEEVDIVERGGNYGWNVKEGTHCFSTDSPGDPPDSCPSQTPDGDPLVDPIIEYSHGGDIGGAAVVGGYLYEGEAIPGFEGRYVFADWRSNGRLYVATRSAEGRWPIEAIPVSAGSALGSLTLGFGRGPDDELYVLTTNEGSVSGSTGAVHRLVPAESN